MFVLMFVLSSNSLHQKTRPINRPNPQTRIQYEEEMCSSLASLLGTGPVDLDEPNILMERVRGQHEAHNKQNNNNEENKGWFAILLLQLSQPYALLNDLQDGSKQKSIAFTVYD